MAAAGGNIENDIFLSRLEQFDRFLEIRAGGETSIMDVTVSGFAEMFNDTIFDVLRHAVSPVHRIIPPKRKKACTENLSAVRHQFAKLERLLLSIIASFHE